MCGNQRVKVLIHYYLRKFVVLWGFKTAHATVTLRETEYSREKSVVKLSKQDWKSDRSAKLKSGSKIHESMNAGFELNN